jgi:hypothetical protein
MSQIPNSKYNIANNTRGADTYKSTDYVKSHLNTPTRVEIEIADLHLKRLKDLADRGYNDLISIISIDTFQPAELIRLAAIGTTITKGMKLPNRERKEVLMLILDKYIDNCDYDESTKQIASVILSTMDASIDTLFDFKKGKFNLKQCNFMLYITSCVNSCIKFNKQI